MRTPVPRVGMARIQSASAPGWYRTRQVAVNARSVIFSSGRATTHWRSRKQTVRTDRPRSTQTKLLREHADNLVRHSSVT
jgi:hypothetical protein